MFWIIAHIAIVLMLTVRILLRPNRQPESRMAWLLVVLALPYVGAIAYALLGETSIGNKRVAHLRTLLESLPRPEDTTGWTALGDASEKPAAGHSRPAGL